MSLDENVALLSRRRDHFITDQGRKKKIKKDRCKDEPFLLV